MNLDPEGAVILNILSRSRCTPRRHGGQSKELHLLDRDLRRTLLVDSDQRVFVQLDTGIHVDGFTCDSTDQEPGRVRGIIQEILQAEDVRKIPRSTLKLRQRLGQLENSYSDLMFLGLDSDVTLVCSTSPPTCESDIFGLENSRCQIKVKFDNEVVTCTYDDEVGTDDLIDDNVDTLDLKRKVE